MFIVNEYPSRVFGPDGDSIDWEMIPVVELEGITLNGSPLFPCDFERRTGTIIPTTTGELT